MAFQAGLFETVVQELATDLQYTEVGDAITQYQGEVAGRIAWHINHHLDDVRAEYFKLPAEDPLSQALRAKKQEVRRRSPFDRDETVFGGLVALEAGLRGDFERRQRVGEWLAGFLPKRKVIEVDARTVIRSLVRRDELVFSDADTAEAESLLAYREAATAEAAQRAREAEPLAEDRLFAVADGLLRILATAARQDQPLRKEEIYTGDDFMNLPEIPNGGNKAALRRAFQDSWEILVAWFADYDPNYQLFTQTGQARGRRYLLNDPDLAEAIWGIEEAPAEAEPAEEMPETVEPFKGKVVGVTAQGIWFENGERLEYDDAVEEFAGQKLAELRVRYVSINQLIQEAADKLREPRASVHPSVRNLLAKLGPDYLERHISRRKSKVLIRLNPEAVARYQLGR